MKITFNSLGLIFNILGVILISIHSLYDYGISTLLKIWNKDEIQNNQIFLKNIHEKRKSKSNLTSLEKEQLNQFLKNAVTFHLAIIVISTWLWINKYVFFFHPWIDDKPREVNRFLWNFIGLIFILIGFIFQLIDSL